MFVSFHFAVTYLDFFRLHFINYKLDPNFLERPIEISQKVAYMASSLDVDAVNQKHYRNFAHKKCRQPMRTDSLVIYFQKNFFLVDAINEKLGVFLSSGIVENFIKKLNNKKIFDNKSKSGPRKLSLSHLFGVFGIFSIGCAASNFAFLAEHIFQKLKKR